VTFAPGPGPPWLTMPVPASPWVGLTAVSVLTSALVAAVWTWRRAAHPPAEHTRKAVHVGMGLVAATMPWLFDRTWPVLLLCGGMTVGLVGLRLFARRTALGAAMHDVGRASGGDVYFAASVAVLWLLAAGERLLFLVPALVLTLGDATAALVGTRYGRRYFDDRRGGKTLEGSGALFVVAFLSVLVPLALAQRGPLLPIALVAATMAVLVTLLEAVAWHGLDNVLVPIGAFLVLRDSLGLSELALAWRFAAAVGCLCLVVLARSRTTLSDAALAGAALVGYLVWALRGGWWLVPPAALFAVYTWLFPRRAGAADREHDIHAVAGVTLPALAWLFLGQVAGRDTFVPYVATFVAQMAMIGVVHASRPGTPAVGRPLLPLALGGALLMLPVVMLVRPWPLVPLACAASLAGATMAGLAINRGRPRVAADLYLDPQWDRQARWALAASLVAAPLLTW
jgi:phytol kinase